NSVSQVRDALSRIYGVEKQDEATTRALAEAAAAIRQVKTTLRPVEISPQNAYLRRLQHQLVAENELSARSTGKEPQRRLRITPSPEEPALLEFRLVAKRGLFITFEGTEGSGKTTQAELLGEWLSRHDPVAVREPGGTELGEQIRDVLLYKGLEIDPEAEMYLFMASRRQLIAEVIVPALAAGQIVIADRYHDSTLAYQGGAR